ncbi:hypothetical protein DFH09DRAFT_1445445 [Mycena vulgaris]|nr:hypothetical protein DFH09DRAFT_1445445 [Mycena vulgaris]
MHRFNTLILALTLARALGHFAAAATLPGTGTPDAAATAPTPDAQADCAVPGGLCHSFYYHIDKPCCYGYSCVSDTYGYTAVSRLAVVSSFRLSSAAQFCK